MNKDLIERVAKAMFVVDFVCEDDWNEVPPYIRDDYKIIASTAIEEYEAAKQEAEDAEDERLYTEFHK